jgi:hypothetical protein
MIGVFDTKERMEEAFKRTQRPEEMAKIEAQGFDNLDRAIGALQGRYPKLTMGNLNDFQMAEIKATPSTWALPDGVLLLGGLILVVLIVGAVLHPEDKPGGLPFVNSMEIPEDTSSGRGWLHAEGYGAEREIQTRVEPQGGPAWTTTEGCYNSAMSGKRPSLEGTCGGEATMNEVKRTEFCPPPRNAGEGSQKGNRLRQKAQRERTKELGARFHSSLSHRLDPDEIPPMGTNTKSSYKMNEFSCYDCMKPTKTRKQLCNHLNGRGHRNVVDFRERTEEGYVPDRGRSPFGVALLSR